MGILCYNKSSMEDLELKLWVDIFMVCLDEIVISLRFVLFWVVEDLINVMLIESKIQYMVVISGLLVDLILSFFQVFYFFRNVLGGINGFNLFQINFSDLVFFNLDNDELFKNKFWEIYFEGCFN